MSDRRRVRAAGVSELPPTELLSEHSAVWADGEATIQWLRAHDLNDAAPRFDRSWEQLYPGYRHHYALARWAAKHGAVGWVSPSGVQQPDWARLRVLGSQHTCRHALEQARFEARA